MRLQAAHHLGLGAMVGPSRKEVVVGRGRRMAKGVGHERCRRKREHRLVWLEPGPEVMKHPVQCAHLLAAPGLHVDGCPAAVE